MIRPSSFGFNEETAASNAFQHTEVAGEDPQSRALAEFDRFVEQLRYEGIEVVVVDDTPTPRTPDALFPNNWVSFHSDGRVVLYPMLAPNRRLERRRDVIDRLATSFQVGAIVDLTEFERDDRALEGTGSLVLDRERRLAYAALSPRTDRDILQLFADRMAYRAVPFDTDDGSGQPVYHTNVILSVADTFAVVCSDVIASADRGRVLDSLAESHDVIEIDRSQMFGFAGNVLALRDAAGGRRLVISTTARRALRDDQCRRLDAHASPIEVDIPTIERHGGGGVRCMLAELFLPRRPGAPLLSSRR
ncbi:MAG: amidinotransferase [Planctomycetes bacterium]|nr:amidinotransferase [Planctomycetota bacterium]